MTKKLLICLLFCATSLYSQTKRIKGRVISEFMETLSQISITANDSIWVGRTDEYGYFNVDVPNSTKKIYLDFIGMETVVVELIDNCDRVEIVMLLSGTDDFYSPKKIQRRLKKRFSYVKKIHEEAYKKGLFRTKKVCCPVYLKNLY